MRMRHAISTMIGILAMLGILPGTTLWAPGPAAARAEDVPLASSLQLESVMLVGGGASAGPFIPVIGDGTAHLAYEYYLTNYGKKAARIVSLRVRGIGGAAFATTIEGDALRSSFTPAAPQSRLAAYDPVLAPGASGVITFVGTPTVVEVAKPCATMDASVALSKYRTEPVALPA